MKKPVYGFDGTPVWWNDRLVRMESPCQHAQWDVMSSAVYPEGTATFTSGSGSFSASCPEDAGSSYTSVQAQLFGIAGHYGQTVSVSITASEVDGYIPMVFVAMERFFPLDDGGERSPPFDDHFYTPFEGAADDWELWNRDDVGNPMTSASAVLKVPFYRYRIRIVALFVPSAGAGTVSVSFSLS